MKGTRGQAGELSGSRERERRERVRNERRGREEGKKDGIREAEKMNRHV